MNDKDVGKALDRVLADLRTCTQAIETMRPIVFDDRLLKKFRGTYSANVVIGMQDILCRYAIMALCRIWDKDGDSQSIPSIIRTLKSKKATHQRIKRIEDVVDKMLNSERFKRLHNWRDKNLGHALVETHREKNGGPIANPIWDDIFALARRSCVIFEAVALAAAAVDFAEQRQIFAADAQAFWGSFIDRPQ